MTVETLASPRARRMAAEAALMSLFTVKGRADPYRYYAQLREIEPVYLRRSGSVVLTRYEDCNEFLRSPAMVSTLGDSADSDSPASRFLANSILMLNPPDHTRIRRLVMGAFTGRRIVALQERIEKLTAECLDAIEDAGSDGGVVNLRDLLAFPMPSSIIATLLGIPECDWGLLYAPMSAMVSVLDVSVSEAGLKKADEAAAFLLPYFEDMVAQRRREPREDLTTVLAAAGESDDLLKPEELLSTLLFTYAAGFSTSEGMITNGTLAILQHPEQLRALRADPGLVEGMVNETLRYDTPVQTVSRMTGRDTTLAGVRLPAGTKINAFLGAANRDPDAFPDPDVFDITRTGAKNLSFGAGIHACVGAVLARTEGVVAFPALFERFPRLALAGEPRLSADFNFRSYADLPVRIR